MTDTIAVTTPPYTEADLLNEAARYTADDMDALEILTAMADRAPWNGLDTDAFNEAHNEVVRLAENASDVSYWAVRLGEAGLTPQTPMAWIGTTTGDELAVQVATSPDIKDDVRDELLREIRKAVDTTVKRVLKAKDV